MIELPALLPAIELFRPQVVTIDDCCEGDVVNDAGPERHLYKLAFRAIDGQTALYSVNGDSEPICSHREWIVPADRNWLEQPLYVGIHDPRSVMENSKEQAHD